MAKLYWYLILAVIGVIMITYSVYKKRHIYKVSTLLVYALAVSSSTWTAEFIVLGAFDSYGYRTGVITDIWSQNLLGHLILNTTLYPAVSVVMAAFSLRYLWIMFSASFFTLMEYMFVSLRIYEQHWWRYYMTFIAVIIFLLVARKWFEKVKDGCSGTIRAITFYFVAMLIVHLPAPVLLLLGKQHYEMGFLTNFVGNLNRASIIIIFVYHMVECFFIVLCTCVFKKWYWRIMPFIVSVSAQSIFALCGVLVTQHGWNLAYTLFTYEIFIALFIYIEKNTLIPKLN